MRCCVAAAQAQIVEQSALSAKMKMRERLREEDLSNLRAKLVSYETHPPPSPFHSNNTSLNSSLNTSGAGGAEFTEMEVLSSTNSDRARIIHKQCYNQ